MGTLIGSALVFFAYYLQMDVKIQIIQGQCTHMGVIVWIERVLA